MSEGEGRRVRVREADVMAEAEVGVTWGHKARMQAASGSWKRQGNGILGASRRNNPQMTHFRF